MNYVVVSDSSCNVYSMAGEPFASVPMKVTVDREYVDRQGTDAYEPIEALRHFKGKASSSCPNVGEWLESFGDAELVFGVTISKHLSGSFNAACNAAHTYMEEHPGRRVYIVDSMAAGPAMAMYAEKLLRWLKEGMDEHQVLAKIEEYKNRVHTLFCLESLTNLARNGRVNPAIAKIAGVLGIRACGEGQEGRIGLVAKPRGAKKAIEEMAKLILERGFANDNVVRIAHCFNPEAAEQLKELLKGFAPNAKYIIEPATILCGFYAEYRGLIVGFEGGSKVAGV